MSSTSAPWMALRRPLRWLAHSGSGLFLLEVVAAVALCAEAGALLWFRQALPAALLILLWGQWLVLLLALRYAGLFKLVGPVFFYDLMRLTRRGRYYLVRAVYAALLLLILGFVWLNFIAQDGLSVRANRMSEFAGYFFYTFAWVQYLAVVLLTPAYAAGAIAEEKERKTLQFLLATDLGNREIVLGKLASRLATLGLVVLTGLPILSCLQFLGGVDPGLVLADFAATGVTMLSLASVSIFFSVVVRKTRDAIILAYLFVPTYVTAALLSQLLLGSSVANFPSTETWTSPVTVSDLVAWFNAGNPIFALTELVTGLSGSSLETVLPGVLARYAAFHVLLALVCCTWAVLRMRPIALRDFEDKPRRVWANLRVLARPVVSDWPMAWKELWAEPGFRLHWLGWIFVALLVAASFLPLVLIFGNESDLRSADALALTMNVWVRGVDGVACLMLLAVGVRAASSISGERDRDTFDSLLTSPLDSDDILWGKWLGSVFSLRWPWLWLGSIFALGLLSGGVNVLALPFLIVAWLVFAAFVAMLGLWFSVVSRTTLRATMWTLLTLVLLWGGHWALWMCCIPVMIAAPGGGPDTGKILEAVLEFQAFSLTPPASLCFLAFNGKEFEYVQWSQRNYGLEMLIFSLVGMALWGGATLVLWRMTSERLRVLTGREARRPRPRARPAAPFAKLAESAEEPVAGTED